MTQNVKGFSKLSKEEKINWITNNYFINPIEAKESLTKYWNSDENLQKLHDEFIENTLTNFYLPYGVAPNFTINGKSYTIPMAIEESSVVAAASKAAKFWGERGGFKTTIISTEKIGQVHFLFHGNSEKLTTFFNTIKPTFFEDTQEVTKNMQKRGGGILNIELRDKTHEIPNYYQLHATFNTKDSMGANFINTCLEQFAKTLENQAQEYADFTSNEKNIQIVMSILSNYVPNCLVRVEVSCPVAQISDDKNIDANEFAQKFATAVRIAEIEPYRAVTHNKGIMNGIDAVVLATGNDFRAVEAGIHAYASKSGQYSSLSHVKIENDIFTFWMEIPLALGTVRRINFITSFSEIFNGTIRKAIGRRTNANCSSGWISSKLRSASFVNHNRNSTRTYENAFDEHFKPTSCYQRRETESLRLFQRHNRFA